ncbi:hypothetical protein R5W24_003521 [Gemmata sp. JC717]|uniref:hypothetical protein n=1 Tax=Gemmata algarum TaxID=2975278 RepID=UPI0021BACF5B|nr:hypothetical protein [Gemmata algarum]MDY3554399.1 hypothetical protein [Gemmata algarum]
MAGLVTQIRRMYADIADHGGDFGDGVEHGEFDPFAVATAPGLAPFERAGAAVAVLCWLMCAIDNGGHVWVAAEYGPRVRELLRAGALDHEPLVRTAAEAFFASEAAFVAALRPVYEGVVRRWAADVAPGAAG